MPKAMSEAMPYRGDMVRQLAEAARPFPQGEQNDPWRLEFLKSIVIPTLNQLDGGKWGLVTKTEQGGRVPVDVIMWRDTRTLVDCLTGTGWAWIVLGAPPETWLWTAVEGTVVSDGTDPSALAFDGSAVTDFMLAMRMAYAGVGRTPDFGAAVWVAQFQFDALSMGYPRAHEKQLQELVRALNG